MKSAFVILFLLTLKISVFGQSFEGLIMLDVSTSPGYTRYVRVKGQKSIMEIEKDSSETMIIVKDHAARSTTLLRRKNDLKYGFRTPHLAEYIQTSDRASQVDLIVTQEEKLFGQYLCKKIMLKTADAVAEAWITNELPFTAATYFPEFLSEHTNHDLLALRSEANKVGFVMNYTERHIIAENETTIELTVEEKEIPISVFNTGDFIIIDEQGMKRLYADGQNDPARKKQWEEFMQLFGSN